MPSTATDPPEGTPLEVIEAFQRCDDGQLRGLIHYAQQLLREHPPLTETIASRAGEELVRTEDHDGYTIVVVERPTATGGATNRFAYRVKWDPDVGGGEGNYRRQYLGQVAGGGA